MLLAYMVKRPGPNQVEESVTGVLHGADCRGLQVRRGRLYPPACPPVCWAWVSLVCLAATAGLVRVSRSAAFVRRLRRRQICFPEPPALSALLGRCHLPAHRRRRSPAGEWRVWA